MSIIRVGATIHICEDTEGNFDIRDILASAGIVTDAGLKINSMQVFLPDGTLSTKDTPLFGKVDADTVYVRPGQWHADYNGKFATVEVVLDQGSLNTYSLSLQVVVDPVNDAPTAANKSFNLANGNAVVLSQADFGFADKIDGDLLKSVIVTSLPTSGKLLLDGVALDVNAEVSAADIAAGKLAFVPSQTVAGSFDLGFKVRDNGGLSGCGAADTSVTPNYLTFKVPQAHIGDFVWEDTNGNGVQDSGEAGLAGVVVELKDAAGHTVASTTTDSSGKYHFDIDPGVYAVSVQAPAGYTATTRGAGADGALDSDIGVGGATAAITLAPGETNNQADAGLVRTVAIGDTVWYDSNRDGLQSAGEAGVAGVKVTLLDAGGKPTGATVTTDAAGHYQFSGLQPGSYSVQFDKTTLPAGYVFTAQGTDAAAVNDSNANADGLSAAVTLASGQGAQHIDAGIVVKQATVGDRVWEDSNGNGVRDTGEAGLDGVRVDLKDGAGNVVASTVTHDGGQYSFTVDPGTYAVSVKAPDSFSTTLKGQGGDGAADSDVDAAGDSATFTLAPDQIKTDIDAGLYRAVSVGDKVWFDANRDGVQDGGEAGVAGVKVVLLDASGTPTGNVATTDANGNYQFTGLKPGSYSVQFVQSSLPADYAYTTAGQGGAGQGSAADASTGKTGAVTLASGEHDSSLDAGLVKVQGTLGDRVWEDSNGNGVQDAGEAGVDGVLVSLKDADGNVVATSTTHDGGAYSFTVDPGVYSVAVKAPDGYAFTAAGKGASTALDSDVDAAGVAAGITVTAGSNNHDVDAGVYRPASLSQVVWFDANRDGRLNNGETGAAGVIVTLLDANGAPVPGAVATTDADGHYAFNNLAPGKYSVQFDKGSLAAGYNFTSAAQGGLPGDSDADAGTGKTAQVTLASGDNLTLRAGLVTVQATVGDRVWEDRNGNGVQDSGEAGLDGVKVDLRDSFGNVVSSTVTHDGGKYSFTVDAGTYAIAVTAPDGYTATGKGLGGNAALDSDIGADGATGAFTLAANQVKTDLDMGFYKAVEIGDTVWNDANRNGVQDSGETGRSGVKVTLLDAAGAAVATATTDTDGHYLFNNLAPGSYSVQFDKASLGDGYVLSAAHAAGATAATDSDADAATGKTQQVTLNSGESSHDLDAGVVVVQATVGDRVWEDKNGNGVQDSGEAGLVGVKVDLKDENGKVVQTATTGADGKYSFTVDPGKYAISVTAPTGMTATAPHTGANGIDSDISADGTTGQFTLTAGQVDKDIDAGFYKGATLGDRVWLDLNRNGVQDTGETGVAGVKVTLLDAAGNAVLDASGAAVGATTDASGNYNFSSLKPGTYSVQFDKATLPANHIFTAADQGTSDARDSDVNVTTGKSAQVTLASGDVNSDLDAGIMAVQAKLGDTVWEDKNGNGVQDGGEAGMAGVSVQLKDSAGKVVQTVTTDKDGHYSFTANPGSYTVSVTAPKDYVFTGKDVGSDDLKDSDVSSTGQSAVVKLEAGDVNNSVDAGLYKTASVGDKVWLDTNKNGIQDSGECGVCGVKVILLDADGNQVGKAVTTDADGNYLFSGLKPGNYTVQIDKSSLPEGVGFTKANQGASDAADSDFNAGGASHTVTLSSGQVDKTVDAGLVAAATIGDKVWIDRNGNGLQDDGSDSGKAGVTVELRDTDGGLVKSVVTDKDGNYKFSVEAGTYSVNIKTPSGYLTTTQAVGKDAALDSNADASGKLGTVTVTAGQSVTNLDAGLVQKAEIGDKVWYDSNGDGIQQSGEAGAKGVKVTLLNEKGVAIATDTTDGGGLYAFTDLAPGKYSVKFDAPDGYIFTKQDQGSNDAADSDADSTGLIAQFAVASGAVTKTLDAGLVKSSSIGDRVWEDLNYNGVQDAGEKGVDGVLVKLYDANNVLKATTTTHDGGQYLFDNLAAGSYKVEVTNSSGWYFTKTGAGTDVTDSDITSVSGSVGRTGSITLGTGQNITTEDAGIYRKAAIGDKVWRDANHNGVQDTGEEGIGGISVSLYDATTNKQVGTTIKTDASGNYKFADLNPGNYYLVFDKTNVKVTFASDHATYNMSDWKWGVKNVGSNDAIDSDVAGDGKALTNVTKTDTITLTSGKNDMSWDATITPIAIDLNGDGIHTIARDAMTGSFDLLGSGKAIQSGWLSSGDGFLAIDSNGNGKIDDISELFGGASKGSGFAKLASYDSNGDGVVDASDAQFSNLLVWRDANSDGKTDAGELVSLKAAGIVSLSVGYTELPFLDENNNLHLERSSVTLANGGKADMTDVYFNVAAADAAAAGVTAPTVDQLIQSSEQLAGLVGQAQAAHA